MKLTKAIVAQLKLPTGKVDHIEWDNDIPGLGVRLRSRTKTWIFQYRVGQKQRRMKLGSANTLNDIGVQQVRKRAAELHAQVMLGHDPHGEKIENQVRAAETFEPAMQRFLAWKKDRLKPRSYEEVERHLVKHAKPLHGLQLAKIDRRTIASRLADLAGTTTPKVSDAVRASLSAFFTWCMREGLVNIHPVVGTNRAHEARSRERVLADNEIRQIWHALPNNDYGDVVRLLILCAQRRDEIGSLRWSEIDLDRAQITLPGARTKNKREHVIPLAPAALAILKARSPARPDDRDFVFGGGQGGFSGWSKCKTALDQSILDARKKVATDPAKDNPISWRLHDARRTASTVMHDRLGIAPHIVEAALNHISGHKQGVAGTYNKARYLEQTRAALEGWAEHIDTVVSSKVRSGTVIKLRRRRK